MVLAINLSFIRVMPIVASEEENIDSFDVHPANRWSYFHDNGVTDSVSNGNLALSDTGDSTTDWIGLERNLTIFDDEVEFKFKVDGSSNTGHNSDEIEMGIQYSYGYDDAGLLLEDCTDEGYWDTYIYFESVSGSPKFLQLTGSEQVIDEEWYVFNLKYHIYKSEMEYSLKFANGTKVFEYTYFEIDTSSKPEIFTEDEIHVFIHYQCYTSLYTQYLYLDYVQAPFKMNEWIQTDAPNHANWLINEPYYEYAQDNIDEWSKWDMAIPNLDSVMGHIRLECDGANNWASSDDATAYFNLYGVDKDDGDIHAIFLVYCRLDYLASGKAVAYTYYSFNGGAQQNILVPGASTDDHWVEMKVTYSLSDDRSKIQMQVNARDDAHEDWFNSPVTDHRDIADVTGLTECDEFYLRRSINIDIDGDIEIGVELLEFDMKVSDIFAGFLRAVMDPIANFFGWVLQQVGLFLASIFKFIGDALVAALDVLGDGIDSVIGVLQVALETAIGAVETAVDALGNTIDTIMDGVETVLETAINAVQTAIQSIVTWLVNGAQDLLTAIFEGLTVVWSAVETWFFGVYDDISTTLFGEPLDLLGLVAGFADIAVATVSNTLQLLEDIDELLAFWDVEKIGLLVFGGLIFVPFMLGNSFRDGVNNVKNYNFSGVNVYFTTIPIGILLLITLGVAGLA